MNTERGGRGHQCPAPGCSRNVVHNRLACVQHWFRVPKPMRDELWHAYRDAGPGSTRHWAAVSAIVNWFASDDYAASLPEAPEWTI